MLLNSLQLANFRFCFTVYNNEVVISLTSTSNTDTKDLCIYFMPIPNIIVLIMRTRLQYLLDFAWISVVDTSEVDRFSVVAMCHDTDGESIDHRVISLIPLLVSKCLF